jgi:ubiquinone/menaquinone biosynthesis C-methylase UbiE
VVDVGCGIGRTASYFAKAVAPDGHVIGFDESEELIALARHLAAEQGIDNITFGIVTLTPPVQSTSR